MEEVEGLPASLVELKLSGNALIGVPACVVSACVQLKELNLSRNMILTLPKSIGHLTELEKLDLDQNKLTVGGPAIVVGVSLTLRCRLCPKNWHHARG